eukprot:CAMPEP_0181347064 /NCGR_PEP_ID=MMETSP1101-20121128/33677_1 /TAXON_ID=46948 /ORGANISM="Rhodomonas abbreviata, Strain Caron Lab Isolate" /LENGTH=890 /DNA_ID=CAMNT_0023459249 /DNA_START=136 /DNA_END=2804 /DNA_ORIENTATION=+
MGSTPEWQNTVRPQQERIAAVETRLVSTREAMDKLQDKYGRKALDIKGELELLKDHLVRLFNQGLLTGYSGPDDMHEGTLLETQNSELRGLEKSFVGIVDQSVMSHASEGEWQQKLQTSLQELQGKDREIAELREIVRSRAEGDSERVRDLQERCKSQAQALNAKSAAYEELREALQREKESKTAASEQQQNSAQSLEQQLRRTLQEKENLDQQLRAAAKDRTALDQQLRRAAQDVERLEQQLRDSKTSNNGTSNQIDSLSKEITKWQKASDTKGRQLEAMSDELTQLRHENTMLRKRMQKEELDAIKDRDFQEQQNRVYSQKVNSNEAMVEELQRNLNSALMREKDVVKMLQDTNEKTAVKQRELAVAERQLSKLQAHLKMVEDEQDVNMRRVREELKNDVQRMHGQVQQVGQERDRAVAELSELRTMATDLELYKAEKGDLTKELVDARARNAALGNRCEKLEDQKAKLEQTRTELIQELGKLQAANEKLTQDMEAVWAREKNLISHRDNALQAAEEQKSVVNHVNGVLNNMRGEIGRHKAEKEEMAAESEKLKAVLADDRTAKEELTTELAKATRAKEEGEQELAELAKYVASLTAKVEELVEKDKQRQQVDSHTNSVISKLQTKNEELQVSLNRKIAVINGIEEEKGLLLVEMQQRQDEGVSNADAVKQMTEKLSQQAMLLRERNEEINDKARELQDFRDQLEDKKAVLQRASDAEQRLVIALAAVNGKDAALLKKEEQIESLENLLASARARSSPEKSKPKEERTPEEAEILEAQATIASLQGEINHLTDLLVDKGAKGEPNEEQELRENIIIQDLRERLHGQEREAAEKAEEREQRESELQATMRALEREKAELQKLLDTEKGEVKSLQRMLALEDKLPKNYIG